MSEFLTSRNFKYIDCAIDYDCQEIIREYYSGFVIDTKFRFNIGTNGLRIKQDLERFLDECNIEKIRTFYLHNPWQMDNDIYKMVVEQMQRIKETGLIDEIGLSIYWDKVDYDFSMIDRIQVPFSILHGRALKKVKFFRQIGVKVTIRNVFLQGQLLSNQDSLIKDIFENGKDLNKRSRLASILSVINLSDVDSAVLGIDDIFQLSEILEADSCHNPTLLDTELEFLDPRNWM